MGFSWEDDARRVMEGLPKRFEKDGLTLHPEKTRLLPFERPPDRRSDWGLGEDPPGDLRPAGFHSLLGPLSPRLLGGEAKTSKSRLSRGLKALRRAPKDRHRVLADQHRTLSQKRRGHFADSGITGNADAWKRFRRGALGLWRKWLSRRNRDGPIAWDRMYRLLAHSPLPPAIVVHSVYRQAATP